MATQTVTRLVDDLDGTEAVASVTFSFRGSRYEIDLNEDHIDELEQAIEPFIQYARPVGAGPAEAPPSVAPVEEAAETAAAETGRRRRGRPAGSRRPATKRASAAQAASSRGARAGSAPSGHDVRSWAKANGYEIGERGRISAEIREAYEAAVGA